MTWDDYFAIGEALYDAHPEANYMMASREELVRLVVALPGFVGPAEPPDDAAVAAVAAAWIAVAEGPDDSRHESD